MTAKHTLLFKAFTGDIYIYREHRQENVERFIIPTELET
jgi:hypothetical protein